jgi:hypothetical protein
MSIEHCYPGCFQDSIREFGETRDALQVLDTVQNVECEEFISNFYKKSFIARLNLILQIQREIGTVAKENLTQAKRLLSALDLTDESILGVIRQMDLGNLELDPALDDGLFDAIMAHYSALRFDFTPENDSSQTFERLFKNYISYEASSREQKSYSNQTVEQFIKLIKHKKIDEAFQLLLTLEQIPPNLRVSKMQKPLLQKYLWNAVKCNENLAELTNNRDKDYLWNLQEAHRVRACLRFDFDSDVANALRDCLEEM